METKQQKKAQQPSSFVPPSPPPYIFFKRKKQNQDFHGKKQKQESLQQKTKKWKPENRRKLAEEPHLPGAASGDAGDHWASGFSPEQKALPGGGRGIGFL